MHHLSFLSSPAQPLLILPGSWNPCSCQIAICPRNCILASVCALAQVAWISAGGALKMMVFLHPFKVSSTSHQGPPISLSQGGACNLLFWAARRPSQALRTPVWPQASEDGLKRPGNVPPDLAPGLCPTCLLGQVAEDQVHKECGNSGLMLPGHD